MSERAKFTFTVKESADGRPWIAAEQLEDGMPSLVGQLGFDLRPGTTFDQAKDIAKYLRERVVGLSLDFTVSPKHLI
jgi:hypothetical protein